MRSPKSNGVFVEVGHFSLRTAFTSALRPPLVIESLEEYTSGDNWTDFEERLESEKGSSGVRYLPACCGVYPDSRFFRRHTIESFAKAKDPNYFTQLISEQFRIDSEKNVTRVVNAVDGSVFTLDKSILNQKEIVICGGKRDEFALEQEKIVGAGLYPETLELGTAATVGGLIHYLKFKGIEQPTLMLEITPSSAYLFIVSKNQIDICRPIPYGLDTMFPLIQEELGLKDLESAKKLFFSNTFDFTEMGSTLLRKMLKELQASTGFYEVQTGMTIGQIFVTQLPPNLSWITTVLAKNIGVKILEIDYTNWLGSMKIKAGDLVQLEGLDSRWVGLLSLMGNYEEATDGA